MFNLDDISSTSKSFAIQTMTYLVFFDLEYDDHFLALIASYFQILSSRNIFVTNYANCREMQNHSLIVFDDDR